MEFKKQNTNNKMPPRTPSRPIDASFVRPRARPRPAPPIVTSSNQPIAPTPSSAVRTDDTTSHEKKSSSRRFTLQEVITSYIRHFKLTKKTVGIGSGVAVILLVGIVLVSVNQQNSNKDGNKDGNPYEVVQDLEYQTILPQGKSINDLGGWRRVSPTKSDPVYAYTDYIDNKSINVSEQPLPDSFIGDTDDQVAELAKKFNATTKIQAGDIKVYVGSSSKGPQSVIFTKNSLLILIKSQEKIDDTAWIEYIKSLS